MGVVIIVLTQCYSCMVSDVYATGRVLTDMGIALGHDMTLEACFTKLSYLMKKIPNDKAQIVKLMS